MKPLVRLFYDECAPSDACYIVCVGEDNKHIATYGEDVNVDLFYLLNDLADITDAFDFEYYN